MKNKTKKNKKKTNKSTSVGSLCKHDDTKSLKNLLKFEPVNSGGLFLGMRKSTLIGCNSAWGGSPFATSIAV